MIIGKNILFTTIVIITSSLPFDSYASLTPQATTSSNQTITASITGSSIIFGEVNASTQTFAMAMSTNPGILDYPTFHSAQASAQVLIPTDLNGTIGTFKSTYSTSAKAFSNEPLFARSAAIGQGSVYAIVSPTNSSTLNLNWQFNSLNLKAEPTSTFSYMSDAVNIVRQTTSGFIRETVAGFYTFLENGKQTIGFWGNNSVTETIKNWFDSNTTLSGNQLSLNNPNNLNLTIDFTQQQAPFFIGIENTHTEISYEAPPAATNQVDEKLGYLASDTDNNLHWNAESRELSFDRLPINMITNLLNTPYSNDPLYNGYLEIDPLQMLTNANGRDYFVGKELRLVDKNGQTLYTASLPSVVFDDELFNKQGFNLFAPILNVLTANPSTSNWLQRYLAKSNINSLLLPELFIGFNPQNEDNIWKKDFDAPASTFLSFTGVPSAHIPEPNEISLLILGFATLVAFSRKITRQRNV